MPTCKPLLAGVFHIWRCERIHIQPIRQLDGLAPLLTGDHEDIRGSAGSRVITVDGHRNICRHPQRFKMRLAVLLCRGEQCAVVVVLYAVAVFIPASERVVGAFKTAGEERRGGVQQEAL